MFVAFTYSWLVSVIALSALAGARQLGYYTAASQLASGLLLLVHIPIKAVYPEMVRRCARSRESFSHLVDRLVELSTRVTLAIAAFVIVEAPAVTSLFFGRSYAPSGAVLRFMFGIVPLGWYGALVGQALLAGNGQRFYARAMQAGALVATVGYAPASLLLGATGAGAVSTTVVAAQAVVFTLYARARLQLSPYYVALRQVPYGLVPLAVLLALSEAEPVGLPVALVAWLVSVVLLDLARGAPSFQEVRAIVGLMLARRATSS
jgi:O-antigen/teichoic acid export membrane protein